MLAINIVVHIVSGGILLEVHNIESNGWQYRVSKVGAVSHGWENAGVIVLLLVNI